MSVDCFKRELFPIILNLAFALFSAVILIYTLHVSETFIGSCWDAIFIDD